MNAEAGHLIRCPYCLRDVELEEILLSDEQVQCTGCKREFEYGEALPSASSKDGREEIAARIREAEESRRREEAADRRVAVRTLLFGIPTALILGLSSAWWAHGMRGPDFLGFYAVFFALTFIASTVLRHRWHDTMMLSVVGCLAFESVGLLRLLTFSGTRFNYLYLGMFVGGVLFFLRAAMFSSLGDRSDGGGFFLFGGGCGGGSGGGGGCGGGCGGCGGG